TEKIVDPAVPADQARAGRMGRRVAERATIDEAHSHWQQLRGALEDAHDIAQEDPDVAGEVPQLADDYEPASATPHRCRIPRAPADARNVILGIKGGEGGEEAALFAADLARMYLRYAEHRGWKTEIISATESDLGGYKDVHIGITGNAT